MAMEFVNGVGAQSLASVANVSIPSVAASLAFWLRYTSLVANVRRICGSAGNFEIRGGNGAGTQTPGTLVNDLFNNSDGAVSVTTLVTDVWYHIVCTGEFTAGNSITDIYIDGVLDAGPTTVAGAATAAAIMTLGNRTGAASTEGLNGFLDDWRLYDRRLSAAEIQTIHASRGHDSILEGMLARVLFEEGDPGSSPAGAGAVKDMSLNVNHYTPTGSPVFRESLLSTRRKLVA